MLWWGLLLILAGLVIIIRSVRAMTIGRRGPGAETGVWTGFLGLALLGLGVATLFGLYPE